MNYFSGARLSSSILRILRRLGAISFVCSAFIYCGSNQLSVFAAQTNDTASGVLPALQAKTILHAGAGEAWRKQPPSLPPPRPFKLPNITTYKLDNGLTVQLVENKRFPWITANIGIKAGSTFESTDKLGLADMTADMLTEGTESKKSREIADAIDFIGGGLKASSDYDYSLVGASCLSKYTDQMFDLLSDVLLHPSFPQEELSLKKANLIQELAMKRSEPDFLVEERFNKVLFGNHPYAVVAPTPQTVQAITRQDLIDFHKRFYLPNESVLIVIGNFDEAKIKNLIASHFGGDWKPGILPGTKVALMPSQHGRHIYLVNRPDSVQSAIRLGNISIKKSDPDFFPMMVANEILGGATQARLFLNIREQKGYTYGAYSAIEARKQPGSFSAQSAVRTEVTGPSLQEFLYELDRIRNTKVSDKELKDAKAYLVGSFQLGLETESGLAARLLDIKMYDLPDDYLESYVNKVMAVTADDVRRVAHRLIDLDNIVIAVVGDAKKVKPELEYFGPVEVWESSGVLSTGFNNKTTSKSVTQ